MKRYDLYDDDRLRRCTMAEDEYGDYYLASEADAAIKDLSLRIAVVTGKLTQAIHNDPFEIDKAYLIGMRDTLTMPIESLHEFIKQNPQYGEKV